MLRLDLAARPRWLDLGHGVRLQVAPLTTALMVAARSDPALDALAATASDEARALAFAKGIARIAVSAWEGVGNADGNPVPVSPEGIDALLEVWPIFEAFQANYVAGGLLLDAEKKRLRALADWHFGGGDRYCAACQPCDGCGNTCSDCPARLNRPATLDGWQVWDLALRLGGQLRVAPGVVIGWDLGAALALASALGVAPLAAAELLPEIEAVMVRKLGVLLAAILLLLLAFQRSGERLGRLAERLEAAEKSNDVEGEMLEAAARRPRDRDELAGRLRDGQF